MKPILGLFYRTAQTVVAVALLALLLPFARADTGKLKATRVEVGNLPQTSSIWCPSGSTVTVLSARDDRADAAFINLSSYTVYVGSVGAPTFLTTLGFPILSTGIANLGAMSGAVSCTSGGAGAAEIRLWQGITQ